MIQVTEARSQGPGAKAQGPTDRRGPTDRPTGGTDRRDRPTGRTSGPTGPEVECDEAGEDPAAHCWDRSVLCAEAKERSATIQCRSLAYPLCTEAGGLSVCRGRGRNFFFLFVSLTLNPHIFLKPQCFLKRPKHGILYAYRAEPEAQRPLDSASNGLSQSGPVNKSALRVSIVTVLIVVGALSRVIIVVEGHLQFLCCTQDQAKRRTRGQKP